MNEKLPVARTFSPQAENVARQTTLTNMTLSQMADQKASILLGATFLVFTLTVGQVSRGAHAAAPLLVLGAFAVVAACFAAAVVMPSVRSRPMDERANLMFFAVISQFEEEEYIERMLDNLTDDEGMYRMVFRDIWQNAQVLQHKKYRLLGYAYRSFLAGLITSAIVFGVQYSHLGF